MDQPDTVENHSGPATSARATPLEIKPRDQSPSPLPPAVSAFAPMGAALAPVLVEVCGRRLTEPRWFRTDWQRGGALTGYATWTDERGREREAVVKMPVPPNERRWLVQMSSDDITPRVFAHGRELGGYDLAWVVMERLPHGPLGSRWGASAIDLLCEAAAVFYARASPVPIGKAPAPRDWRSQLKRSRDHISKNTVPESQRWRKALKKAGRKLDGWLEQWRGRDRGYWCHGDLHLGNAMSRRPAPDGPAVLFDLAVVAPGHWIEDAIYLEHLYWANPAAMHGRKPASLIAQSMHNYNVCTGEDWPQLANIYRALLAMSIPGHMDAVGGGARTTAALNVLERHI